KPLVDQITPLVQVQRQEEPEEEEEMLQAKPLAEEITPLVQRQVEPEEEEEDMLQAKTTSGHISEANPNLESDIQSLKGGGQPLSENDRAFFEPRFGHDFSQVRVHTDSRAAESARGVNARAFTMGKDIVFGAGEYEPEIAQGKRLLGHELTHVIQQRVSNALKKVSQYSAACSQVQKMSLYPLYGESIGIQFKKIKVGDPELEKKEDLNFSIATVLGESSPAGPITEKQGIAMVIKKRVETRLKGNSTFRDIILKTGIYGNPNKNALAHLAELYLNKKPKNLKDFTELVNLSHKTVPMSSADEKFLKKKGGFNTFKTRIEQVEKAMESVLKEEKFKPPLVTLSKEATWWGGEVDLWDKSTCKIHKHGRKIVNKNLVFAVYEEFGKTYFLKDPKAISDENTRKEEIKKSKEFLCSEIKRRTKCTLEKIETENQECKK
ncbi:MAG: DUF4157 domain-containing protein, partial [Candidatus Omnitrophica bacterium]|nr:DUF4157 domain-containing protein [Candidatus Omnitrophota bacterium]